MNRTVKSCFAAGAAFAALAFAPAAHAQFRMDPNGTVVTSIGAMTNVTVSVTSIAANVAQITLLYDSTFLTTVDSGGAASTQGAQDLTAAAMANGWSESPQSDAQLTPTNALWPVPQKSIKLLSGNSAATAVSGAFAVFHFKWTGPAGTTVVEFASSRFPGTAAPSTARTRTSNAGVITQDTFVTGATRLSLTTIPAPSAVLAFAAGLPLLGVALRRRK